MCAFLRCCFFWVGRPAFASPCFNFIAALRACDQLWPLFAFPFSEPRGRKLEQCGDLRAIWASFLGAECRARGIVSPNVIGGPAVRGLQALGFLVEK